MKNFQLSPKVKAYFVNALKGIGIGESSVTENFREFSSQEIADFIDNENTTVNDIFNKISMATTCKLAKDISGDRRLEKFTGFNRFTVVNAISTNQFDAAGYPSLKKEDYISYVDDLCDYRNAGYHYISTQAVIKTLMAGINDQKILKDKDKGAEKEWQAEAMSLWNSIADCKYENWKTQQQDPQNPAMNKEQYYNSFLYKNLKLKTIRMFGNNQQLANEFLNMKFDSKSRNFLKANHKLMAQAEKKCIARGADPKENLLMQDVLLALTEDHQIEQVITFFQSRSQEQKILEKQDKKEVTRENKIGNLMGDKGRKMMKKAAVSFDKEKGGKKGKAIWRGYKELYEKISSFLGQIYGNVMTMSFVENIMKREGRTIPTDEVAKIDTNLNQKERPWEIETDTPAQFKEEQGENVEKNSLAKKFYEKTKARLLADKMKIGNISISINNPATSAEKLPVLNAQYKYLQGRIQTAEKVIAEISALPKDDPLLQNQRYFNQLENQILNERYLDGLIKSEDEVVEETIEDIAEDETQEVKQEPQSDKKNASYEAVKELIDSEEGKTANNSMSEALCQFQYVAKSGVTSLAEREAVRSMAREMFGLSSVEIPNIEVDAMVDKFIGQKLDTLQTQLRTNSQEGHINVRQAFTEIKNFVQDELKENVFSEQYTKYLITENRNTIIEDMGNELNR